jgi:hypothetical protein
LKEDAPKSTLTVNTGKNTSPEPESYLKMPHEINVDNVESCVTISNLDASAASGPDSKIPLSLPEV